ncbi:hypothetical protein PoB_003190000 [Plakobranchus ocellatus]|uniref:Uncharacterized protein n=1 Tax=Plakobranchus ocellatus TaxID=259542 RepID=A0AAV4AB45_9GAST|nr:hypothetical protein PoB_003190000 [Plakobranchus ocellatus]
MSVPPESIDLTLEEENVTYIAGYIAKKIFPLLCYECGFMLHTSVDPNNPRHIFLQLKQFNACAHGGLIAPSPLLFSPCKELETSFRMLNATISTPKA